MTGIIAMRKKQERNVQELMLKENEIKNNI